MKDSSEGGPDAPLSKTGSPEPPLPSINDIDAPDKPDTTEKEASTGDPACSERARAGQSRAAGEESHQADQPSSGHSPDQTAGAALQRSASHSHAKVIFQFIIKCF